MPERENSRASFQRENSRTSSREISHRLLWGESPQTAEESRPRPTALKDVSEVEYVPDSGSTSGRLLPQITSHEEAEVQRLGCMSGFNESKLDLITGIVIFINACVMGLEVDFPWKGWDYIEEIMLLEYVWDLSLRVKWNGVAFFKHTSNWLDVTIVVASLMELWLIPVLTLATDDKSFLGDVTLNLRFFRMLRLVRIVRLIKITRPLYSLLIGMHASLHRVFWVISLLVVFLYFFALLFVELIGKSGEKVLDRANLQDAEIMFGSVFHCFFELFRAGCGDYLELAPMMSKMAEADRTEIMLAYMIFQISTPWFLVSLFTAVVVDTTIKETQREDRLESLQEKKGQEERLRVFLSDLEVTDADEITYEALVEFLLDADRADELRAMINLAAPEAVSIWETMQADGLLLLDEFVEGLLIASSQSVDGGILRIESRLRRIQNEQWSLHILMLQTQQQQQASAEVRLEKQQADPSAPQKTALSMTAFIEGELSARAQQAAQRKGSSPLQAEDARPSRLEGRRGTLDSIYGGATGMERRPTLELGVSADIQQSSEQLSARSTTSESKSRESALTDCYSERAGLALDESAEPRRQGSKVSRSSGCTGQPEGQPEPQLASRQGSKISGSRQGSKVSGSSSGTGHTAPQQVPRIPLLTEPGKPQTSVLVFEGSPPCQVSKETLPSTDAHARGGEVERESGGKSGCGAGTGGFESPHQMAGCGLRTSEGFAVEILVAETTGTASRDDNDKSSEALHLDNFKDALSDLREGLAELISRSSSMSSKLMDLTLLVEQSNGSRAAGQLPIN